MTYGVNKSRHVQATETMVIGTKSVNEILFQFNDSRQNTSAAGVRAARLSTCRARSLRAAVQRRIINRNRGYELQENNTITQGKHTMKFGARLRESQLATKSTSNFNGTYTFTTPQNASTAPCLAGYTNPNSLDVYQATEMLLEQGVPMSTILRRGMRTNIILPERRTHAVQQEPVRCRALSRRTTGVCGRTSR